MQRYNHRDVIPAGLSEGPRKKGPTPKARPTPKLCFSFKNTGLCSHGDACRFSHDLAAASSALVPGASSASPSGDSNSNTIHHDLELRWSHEPLFADGSRRFTQYHSTMLGKVDYVFLSGTNSTITNESARHVADAYTPYRRP
jgi:hypothetical protein